MKRWSLPPKRVNEIKAKTGGKCFYCGDELTELDYLDEGGKVVSTHRQWHIDHVKPLSKGGDYSNENLVPACPNCNMKKSDRWTE